MKRFLTLNVKICNGVFADKYKRSYIQIYRRILRKAKQIAIQRKIQSALNSNKEIWNIVNGSRKNSFRKKEENILLKVNNNIVSNKQDVANVFSSHFSETNSLSNNASDSISAQLILKQSVQEIVTDMPFKIITSHEILKTVKQMENKRSHGYDEIPIKIIKDNIDILAEPLAYLFNKCVEQSMFPDQLKVARVLPVHKKGSKMDPKNYRPISLLPILSKIYEKLIKVRLVAHLRQNNILSERQFGYQTRVGTIDAINTLVDDVVCRLNDKYKVGGLFLDLSSAFDTINHNILLLKLEHYGVRGPILRLLESYLSNRKQFVEIKTIIDGVETIYKSKLITLKKGVPQGSILGPILFIIFINDLTAYIHTKQQDVKLTIYADDTNAIVSANSIDELNTKMKSTLYDFKNWFATNDLLLNTNKTYAMLFKSTARQKDSIKINIDGKNIDSVQSVKFLGIHIDMYLNWKKEIKALESTISSACYALRSLRDEVTLKQLKLVYFALIESQLRYSIQFWGNSYKYNIKTAFVLQKRAIRTMLRIPQIESCKEHFRKLGILTVPSLYILVSLTYLVKKFYKYETNEERKKREMTRRKDLKTSITPTLNVVRHSTRHQAIALFNSLPISFKVIYCHRKFQNKLKSLLIKKSYYSVDEYLNDKNKLNEC